MRENAWTSIKLKQSCQVSVCFWGAGICLEFHSTDHVVRSRCRRPDEVCIRKYSCSSLRTPSALSVIHLPWLRPASSWPGSQLWSWVYLCVYSWFVSASSLKPMRQIPPGEWRGQIPDIRSRDICCSCLPSLCSLLLVTTPSIHLGEPMLTSNQKSRSPIMPLFDGEVGRSGEVGAL